MGYGHPRENRMFHNDDLIALIDQITRDLVARYGWSLTPQETGDTLQRSPAGIEATMASRTRRSQPWAQRLRAGRVRMGRQIHYLAPAVARTLVLGDRPISECESERADVTAPGRHQPTQQ